VEGEFIACQSFVTGKQFQHLKTEVFMALLVVAVPSNYVNLKSFTKRPEALYSSKVDEIIQKMRQRENPAGEKETCIL